jgi:Fe-Mn family superoxide dismutase
MAFTLPALPYPADALEAAIDKQTMEIHHGKHHAGYVKNLNAALEGQAELLAKPIEQLLREINTVPEGIRQKVINNGGGHANHSLFWTLMSASGGGQPSGALAEAINSTFGDFATFQQKFKEAAVGRFGSGWAWVTVAGGKLLLSSTANQDSPYLQGQTPVLGLDVWEHAYYLRYQNRRAEYIDAWWKVVDWNAVGQRFAEASK